MPKEKEHVVIIGNGVAGITAARHIRMFSEKKITVISAESKYFFSRTALMYVFMGQMIWENIQPYEDWFWEKNRIDLKQAYVQKIDPSSKRLIFEGGEELEYDKLILATGAVPRKLNCEGENLPGVQGLVTKQDLELLEENVQNCRKAVIVGGGLIGVELAEMLQSRNIQVTMIIRENAFWRNVLPEKDALFVSDYLQSHGMTLLHNSEVERILPDENGRVSAVLTKENEKIDCQLVAVSVGVQPNIDFLKDAEIETETGILVDEYLRTNIDDIYAIGDCVQKRNPGEGRTEIESIWYTARMMGETVALSICGNHFKYNPGNWFNSAKFFDIEYQTYGRVWPEPKENEQHFHWENRNKNRAMTFAFDTKTRSFLGINIFGIRMKHEVFDRWLIQKKTIDFVIANLKKGNFDPEFYRRHEKEIFNHFKSSVT